MHRTQIDHNVRPDSNLILHAAQAVTEEEGFDDILQGVRDRVDEIESLHRTRELTVGLFFFFYQSTALQALIFYFFLKILV